MCWYCYWGWARPVADIYDAALAKLGGNESPLHFGPAHIVWGDENFGDASIQWCLDNFASLSRSQSPEDLVVVRWSLEELAKLPSASREIEPDDYDGSDPDLFPPTIETVRR
jgi:hypothetical protein